MRTPPGLRGTAADRLALTGDGLLPTMLVAGLLFAVLTPLRLVEAPGARGLALTAVTGSLAAVFLLSRAACRSLPVRIWVLGHAHGVGLALGLLGALDSLAGLVVTDQPEAGGAVVLYSLLVVTLTSRRRYAVLVLAECTLGWLAVAASHDFRGDWGPTTVMVGCSVVVAGLLSASRSRTADRLTRAQAAVEAATVRDELTGLANRRGLLAAGRRLLRRHRGDVTVLYLDVDGLKDTNDRYGHAVGDQLLRATAAALRSAVRSRDAVARLGGDEFAVLLGGAGAEEVRDVRDRLQRALEEVGVSASTGQVRATPAETIEGLVDRADAAMYRVKQQRVHRGAPPAGRPAPKASAPHLERLPPTGPLEEDLAWVQPSVPHAPDDFRGISAAVIVLHLALVPAHLLMLPAAQGRTMAVASLALAAAVTVLRSAATSHHRAFGALRSGGGALTLALLLACGVDLVYVLVVGRPWTTIAVLLGIVASGGLMRTARRAALVCGLQAVGWVAVVTAVGWSPPWRPYAVHVLSALVVAGLLCAARSGTRRRLSATERHLRTAALTDDLTGLPNRRGFLRAAAPLLQRPRQGEEVSVLFLDLDGLKQVNDSEGHAAGDRLIRRAAVVLDEATRDADVCARVGGDEFTVLLRCPAGTVPSRCHRLQEAFAASKIAVSIGAAQLDRPPGTLEDLVDRADSAMYAVKQARRSARSPAR